MIKKLLDNQLVKLLWLSIRIIIIMIIVIYLFAKGGPVTASGDWLAFDSSRQIFLNISGSIIKILNLKDLYNDFGIYITDNKYVVSPNSKTSADFETDQIKKLKEYLDNRNMDLVYVNLPTKYIDDNMFFENFGIESYSNRNADLFMEKLSSAGVKNLDLRNEILKDNMNVTEMFFRTDHHWTPQTALWAAGKISTYLNDSCGYDIDLSLYDPANYSYTTWNECWTGEQGSKISSVYIGHDDFTAVKPNFPTSFDFRDKIDADDFSGFFHEPDDSIYKSPDSSASWYYLYGKRNVLNNNIDHGKVLLVCDSYANTLEPFLAIGVSEIDCIVLRDSDQNLIEFLDGKQYDTVLICYAQFMIGAHDDEKSANYKMFCFTE